MTAPNEILGWSNKLSIGGTVVEFVSCDIRETIDIIENDETRGTRTRTYERTAVGLIHYGGSIVMHPTPAELNLVMPFVAQNSTGLTFTDAMQDVTIIHDQYTSKNTYVGRFSRMTLSGRPGQKLELRLDFIGRTATMLGSGNSLVGNPDYTSRPLVFTDASSITLNGTTYQCDQLAFVIDNMIQPTFMMGQTATDSEPTDRVCTLAIQTRYGSTEEALLTSARSGPVVGTPFPGSIAFSNGTHGMSFTWASMVAKPQSVVTTASGQKLRLPLNYGLYGIGYGTTKEVVSTYS